MGILKQIKQVIFGETPTEAYVRLAQAKAGQEMLKAWSVEWKKLNPDASQAMIAQANINIRAANKKIAELEAAMRRLDEEC